jgi:hypothetical protein
LARILDILMKGFFVSIFQTVLPLRLPHFLDKRLTDGEVVSLTHWPPFTPRKTAQKKNFERAKDTVWGLSLTLIH